MDVYEAIKKRRSIRAYQDRPIPEDVLARVLEAARLAPSAKNRQVWKFIVVKDAEQRKRLTAATNDKPFVGQAPVIMAFCAGDLDYEMACGVKGSIVDASIAQAYFTLAATAEGLGTCWIGSFFEDKARAVLGLPEGMKVVGLCPIGYAAEDPAPKYRKDSGEVISVDRW